MAKLCNLIERLIRKISLEYSYLSGVIHTLVNTMENVKSIPTNPQAILTESTHKSDIFTTACSMMKEDNISEGQRIVASPETMGKPQTVTAAVAVMKDQIKDEAQRILATPVKGES